MASDEAFDEIVICAGPVGETAARQAVQGGLSAARGATHGRRRVQLLRVHGGVRALTPIVGHFNSVY